MVKDFFPKRSGFPRKQQKLDFFCFYRVTKTHQDKIAPHYKSLCSRVVKTSDLSTAPISNHPIRGFSLDSA